MLTATLSDKIVITHPRGLPQRTLQFLRRLPDSRWSARLNAWTCTATPYTAAALCSRPDCNAAPQIAALADMVGPKDPPLVRPSCENLPSRGYQVEAFSHALPRAAWYGAMVMGSGKSKVAVDLINERQHKRILVIAPTSVVYVWNREAQLHGVGDAAIQILQGSVKKKAEQAAEALRRCPPERPLYVVVNYESAWREPLAGMLLEQQWDLVICDEAHRIKSPSGSASRYVAKLGRRAPWRIALSGTPMPHDLLDVFGQYRFLDPGIYGTSYYQFKNQYAKPGYFPGQIAGWKNQDEFNERLAVCMFRVGEEVLDLPPMTIQTIPVEMQPEERRVYRQIEDEFVAELNSGEVIAIPNALTRLMRLQQITCGWLGNSETDQVTELGDSKLAAMQSVIEDLPADEPVVVFCWYRHDLARVREMAHKLGRRYGELSGRGRDLTDKACMPDDVDLMGVQMQSGGVGVDLTRAAYVFYYSLGYSWGDYEQSLYRAHRTGQTRPVRVYHMTSRNTVNEDVYDSLYAKRDCVEPVLARLKGKRC